MALVSAASVEEGALLGVRHDCRFNESVMRREIEIVVSDLLQRPRDRGGSCFVAFAFRMDVDGWVGCFTHCDC